MTRSALLAALLIALAGCNAPLPGLGGSEDVDIPPLTGDDDDDDVADDDDSGDDDSADDDDVGDDDDDDTTGGCPAGVTCLDTFPAVVSGDTSFSTTSDFDSYACAPSTDESGPEVLYQIEVPSEGFVTLNLDWVASGVDVDVHLLGSLDPTDCFDRGHWVAGALVPAGTWWVVVDSWVNSSGVSLEGEYDLTVNHVPFDAFTLDGIDAGLMEIALTAFDNAWMDDETDRFEYTLIDFSLPSTQPRLWTMDLEMSAMLHTLHVSHGEASGVSGSPELAGTFSNIDGSHQSSLGMMRTAETYTGSKGYSLRLDGLEQGYNHRVRPRAIVIHGAEYARPEFAANNGYLGRSWGCPAVDDRLSTALIDDISDGSLVLTYYPDGDWELNSDYLVGL